MAAGTVYFVDVRHEGLNKYRQIRGNDLLVVEQKAAVQAAQWAEMWGRKQEAARKRRTREKAALKKEEKKQLAISRTAEAQEALKGLENILKATLDVDDTVDWDSLKDTSAFGKPKPGRPSWPQSLQEPLPEQSEYQPIFTFFDHLIPLVSFNSCSPIVSSVLH